MIFLIFLIICIIAGILLGCFASLVIDFVISLIGAEILGECLLGIMTFAFDIKIALLVIIFAIIRIGKYKIKHGK